VIGYGNPLRADDGLGWHVAQQLGAELAADGIVVVAAHQLAPELAEPVSRASLAVFVDAREGPEPGRVRCETIESDGMAPLSFSHDVDPPTILELARELFGSRPPALLISVDGADFSYGVELSPVVRAALPTVLRQVRDRVDGAVTPIAGGQADA
jgi:hydrogenase maturation protease